MATSAKLVGGTESKRDAATLCTVWRSSEGGTTGVSMSKEV